MTRTRKSPEEMTAAAVDAAIAALEASDIRVVDAAADSFPDVLLHVLVDDRPFTVTVDVVSYCTGQRAVDLIAQHGPLRVGVFPLVVADKITAEGRSTLSDAGWSWLDRRGRMHLRGPAVRVDIDVPRENGAPASDPTGPPITGRGGIGVAYWLCAHPGQSLSPTRSSPELGFAPSTISSAVRRLADAGLVDDDGAGLFPELFWELSAAWRTERSWLNAAPIPALHLSADPNAPTWRRTGTAAAATYGAPVVTSEGGPIELYVPGPVAVSVARRRYGAAEPGTGAAVLAVAPATPVTNAVNDDEVQLIDGWPAAPKIAVALDLAQDRARGREILADWNATGAVWL